MVFWKKSPHVQPAVRESIPPVALYLSANSSPFPDRGHVPAVNSHWFTPDARKYGKTLKNFDFLKKKTIFFNALFYDSVRYIVPGNNVSFVIEKIFPFFPRQKRAV